MISKNSIQLLLWCIWGITNDDMSSTSSYELYARMLVYSAGTLFMRAHGITQKNL